MFYVEHKGHPYAICAVSFKTLEQAISEAKRSCGDAMTTRVYGDNNNLIATFSNDGLCVQETSMALSAKEVQAETKTALVNIRRWTCGKDGKKKLQQHELTIVPFSYGPRC